jgi:hypothetical protein
MAPISSKRWRRSSVSLLTTNTRIHNQYAFLHITLHTTDGDDYIKDEVVETGVVTNTEVEGGDDTTDGDTDSDDTTDDTTAGDDTADDDTTADDGTTADNEDDDDTRRRLLDNGNVNGNDNDGSKGRKKGAQARRWKSGMPTMANGKVGVPTAAAIALKEELRAMHGGGGHRVSAMRRRKAQERYAKRYSAPAVAAAAAGSGDSDGAAQRRLLVDVDTDLFNLFKGFGLADDFFPFEDWIVR